MSASVGEVFENPITGERGVVRVAPNESNGYLLVSDLYLRPGGAVTGEHIHPGFSEAFTVVRGRLGARETEVTSNWSPGCDWRSPPAWPTTSGTLAARKRAWWSKCSPQTGSC